MLTLCSLPAIAAIAALRWRLRVDSSGIARRRFIGWDLWPWEHFKQGKVLDVEGTSTTYILKEKPFWARKLTLELLDDEDQSRLEAIVEGLRMRPPLELPGEMAVRFGFRKEVMLTPGGLLLRDRGEETRYRWQQVQSIRISRLDHSRHNFESIEIVLPDRTLTFSVRLNDHGHSIRSWSATGGGKTPGRGDPGRVSPTVQSARSRPDRFLGRGTFHSRPVAGSPCGNGQEIKRAQDPQANLVGADRLAGFGLVLGLSPRYVRRTCDDRLERHRDRYVLSSRAVY